MTTRQRVALSVIAHTARWTKRHLAEVGEHYGANIPPNVWTMLRAAKRALDDLYRTAECALQEEENE